MNSAPFTAAVDPKESPPEKLSKSIVGLVGLIWLALSLNLCLAVGLFQPNVLTWDQWDYYRPLFEGGNWWDLFKLQHGPHRQGLGFVATSLVLRATHWDSRWDSLWIVSLLSVASLLALRLKWKLTGKLVLWDAWIPVAGLTLGQFEAILITPNASHSAFPLALMMLLANAWLYPRHWVRYLTAGVGAACLTFTGFGIFAGALFTVLLLASGVRHVTARQWHETVFAFVGLSIAIAGWIAFSSNYVWSPAVNGFRFPWTPVSDYFRFIPLMLVHPAGVSGESGLHYFAGALLACFVFLPAACLTWKWIRTAKNSPELDVILLLIGSGILFVCNTAVGRISLGIAAGMSSRYISLMFPLWFGIYLAGATSGRKLPFTIAAAMVWCLAAWPYRDMISRPLQLWPGTVGATTEQFSYFESYTNHKAGWVDTYLKTGSWERAQETNGDAVYPNPSVTRMDEKLEFLRKHQLSFFSASPPNEAFLPWWLRRRTIWNDEFPATDASHILEGKGTITHVTNAAGFMKITLTSANPRAEIASDDVELSYRNRLERFHFDHLPAVFAVPVDSGFNTLSIRRIAAPGLSTPGAPLRVRVIGLSTAPSTIPILFR